MDGFFGRVFRVCGFGAWLVFLVPQSLPAQSSSLDPEAIANQKSQDDILEEADSIFAEVSRLSGEPILRPVTKKFESQAFFREYYRNLLEEQYPPQKKKNIEKAYSFFGFLPPNTDLVESYLDSFLKVVEGLYDPKTQTLYIADWIKGPDQEETLAHELTHALQDQNFGLQSYLDQGARLSLDNQFARSAVMEGQAVAISLNYSLEDKNTDFTKLVNIADWVRLSNQMEAEGKRAFGQKVSLHRVVSFPYVYGTAFLQKYVKAYGWKGMAALFRHPPNCTHQIMHPESFFPKRQNPVGVKIEDLSHGPLNGQDLIWDDTLGEWGFYMLLSQRLPEGDVQKAVRGWRGDRVQVYENPATHQLLSVGYIVFNGEETADDFFRSFRDYLNAKYGLSQYRRADETILWAGLKDQDTEVYVERFGRRAVFLEGTPHGLTAKVRGVLWDVVQKRREK